MTLKLVSFKVCPYVQRAAIVLRYKNVAHDIDYIDLANPPEWFLKLSPLKKVPLLLVNGQVIFESAVICEYLDEAYPDRLHPDDLLQRAHNRSWIEFGSACTVNVFHLTVKPDEKDFHAALADLHAKFDQVEKAIGPGPFFNGERFSMVDATYAPAFQRLQYLDELRPGVFDAQRHPTLVRWRDVLLALDIVRQSCVPDVKTLYRQLIWKRQGYMARYLDAGQYGRPENASTY